jgi:hypothetical protein
MIGLKDKDKDKDKDKYKDNREVWIYLQKTV